MKKKVFKYLFRFILGLVALFLTCSALLYVPFIQDFIKSRVVEVVARKTGWDVRVETIRLSFPLGVRVNGINAITESGDTIVYLNSFKTRVHLMPLLRKRVEVKSVTLNGVVVNMDGMIPALDMKGSLKSLTISDIDVDLGNQSGFIGSVSIDATDIDMDIHPTPKDTTKSSTPLEWSFDIKSVDITNTAFALSMTDPYMKIDCNVSDLKAKGVGVELKDNTFMVERIKLVNGAYSMDMDKDPYIKGKGFDFRHIRISDVNIDADSVFNRIAIVKGNIRNISLKSGQEFRLDSLSAFYEMDSSMMKVSRLSMHTSSSLIKGNAYADMSLFSARPTGRLDLLLSAYIGHDDVLFFATPYSPEIKDFYPDAPFIFNANINGSASRLNISSLQAQLDDSFELSCSGTCENISDIKRAVADIKLNGHFHNLDFIPQLLPDSSLRSMVSIPHNLTLNGELVSDKGNFDAELLLAGSNPIVQLKAGIDINTEVYNVSLATDSLELSGFLPTLGLGMVDLNVKGSGVRFNPMKKGSSADIAIDINKLEYDKFTFTKLKASASLHEGKYDVDISSDDPILLVDMNASGMLSDNLITTNLVTQIKNLDFEKLNLVAMPLKLATDINLQAETNLKDIYNATLSADNIVLTDGAKSNHLGNLEAKSVINSDSTSLFINSGDLEVKAIAETGLMPLIADFGKIGSEVTHQINKWTLDIKKVQEMLPGLNVQISGGQKNVLMAYLNDIGINIKSFGATLSNSSQDGLIVNTYADNFQKDTTLFKQINFSILQDVNSLRFIGSADLTKSTRKASMTFDIDGMFSNSGLDAHLIQKDGLGNTGIDFGFESIIVKDSLSVSFYPLNPIIFYHNWNINEGNYISLVNNNHISADFELTGPQNMTLAIRTATLEHMKSGSALDVMIRDLKLGVISEMLPDMPVFGGDVNATIHTEMHNPLLYAWGELSIDSLMYDMKDLGNILIDLKYGGSSQKGQAGSASIKLNGTDVLTASAAISSSDSIGLRGKVELMSFPLNLANPFIPDAMASLVGTATGEIKVTGTTEKPHFNGQFALDSASVNVSYANADFRLDNQPIEIKSSVVHFNNYKIFAYNNNPVQINGNFNFSNFNEMTTDLRISGNNVELLNVPQSRNQMIYGRMLMNVNTTVKGPVNLLNVRGSMNLLGGTDVTYVMLETVSSSQGRINNLVTFTNFNDTTGIVNLVNTNKVLISGVNILMTINIDQNVKMGINLSPNGDDRVELKGGGDLAFRMSYLGDTDLSGRYVLNGGFVRYNLPVLPLAKTFDISPGSYVEWNGVMMDPYINITAYERIRTNVTEQGSDGTRVVNFDALIIIKNRLDNLDVSFSVAAPDDPNIQAEISSMTAEERSRQAMNLIITKTYNGPGVKTTGSSTNAALNSFIQKEINQFADKNLKGIDLSFGIDEYDQANGGQKRTDYSFRFSKQFFNDRFRIVIGGKVSSGEQSTQEADNSFIQDVALEWNLDKTGNRYLKLFHHTGFESVLEGEIVETGLGIVLKRKVRKLKQLFIFSESKRKRAIAAAEKIDDNQPAVHPKEEAPEVGAPEDESSQPEKQPANRKEDNEPANENNKTNEK